VCAQFDRIANPLTTGELEARQGNRGSVRVDRTARASYLIRMLLLPTLPAGFIAPCLPMTAPRPPSGPLWIHEVKHDGFRLIARKDGERVRLYSRPGNDLTKRFPLIVEAMARLPSSCTIDGEAVACDVGGLPSFDLLRHRQQDKHVFLYAFDLIELGGEDLRRKSNARLISTGWLLTWSRGWC
jgi:ATP-dependent DNA ligase